MMERDENISVIKKEKTKTCGTCVSRYKTGYCPNIGNHVEECNKPQDFGCEDYHRKNEKD